MQNEESEIKSKLERKQEKIYTEREYQQVDRRARIRPENYNVKTDWVTVETTENIQREPTLKVRNFSRISTFIFVISILVFLSSLSFAAYRLYFTNNGVDSNKIVFQFADSPSFADGGQEFNTDIVIANQNNVLIGPVDLVFEYPKGSNFEVDSEVFRERIIVGDIEPGTIKRVTRPVTLYGKEGDEREIKARIEYNIPGSTSIFNKSTSYSVSLKSAPVVLTIDTLKETASNQSLTLVANIEASRGKTLNNFLVNIDYPTGFQFVSADPAPRFDNNKWIYDSIETGEKKQIIINGIMKGEAGDERVFRISGGAPSLTNGENIGVVYGENIQLIKLEKPFIALNTRLDGTYSQDGTYAIEPARAVDAIVTYKNNLSEAVNDVVVSAKLSGDILDKKSVKVQRGYYDSSTNTVYWNRTTDGRLAEIAPGGTGELRVSFSSIALKNQNIIIREPSVQINLAVKASRYTDSRVPLEIIATNPVVAKVISTVEFNVLALKNTGPIQNTGPIPPRVDQETTYTLLLTLKNSSSGVQNGVVSFSLPPGVYLTGEFVEKNENITFDSTSRTVYWKVGDIVSGTGFNTNPSRKVYIQVKAKPSISQLGSNLELANNVVFAGTDSFTGSNIQVKASDINNTTRTENTFVNLDDIVIE